MSRGWHGDPYRHSLASRGVPTGNFYRIRGDPRQKIVADLMILRDRSDYANDRYHHRRIFNSLEKLRDGEELDWNEYSSFRLYIENLHDIGQLHMDDILIIEENFGDLIGAPLHGWDLADIERGKIHHSEFGIVDERFNHIARMSMWFLDPDTGEVPDWDDDEVYARRKDFLEEMDMALLDFEWINEDLDVSGTDFMRRALPVIMKFAADEGVGLRYDDISYGGFDPELDAVMGGFDFDITSKKVVEPSKYQKETHYSTDYVWDYRKFNPKYSAWVME